MLRTLSLLALLPACVGAGDTASTEQGLLVKNRIVPVALTPIAQLASIGNCPNGQAPSSISFSVCMDPIQYECTGYYCGGLLLKLPFGQPNPVCTQASMQTEACSSVPTIDEKKILLPSREDLYKNASRWFTKEFLDAPLAK